MIALAEQISSFKQQLQKSTIADYTPLFQQRTQQEPTLKEVMSENNLIVQSIKMMNHVFLNYCWLNQRVYSKITEHQLNLHDQQSKLNSLTHHLEHKLDESLSNFKHMYEHSVVQNSKNKEIVQVGLREICSQIQTKVNDTQLTDKIKQILIKYDQGNLIKQQAYIANNNTHLPLFEGHQLVSVYPQHRKERKVGKVGFDDYYKLQDQMDYNLASVTRQIYQVDKANHQNHQRIASCASVISKQQQAIHRMTSQISKIKIQHKYQYTHLKEEIENVNRKLEQGLSEEQWKKKFTHFQVKNLDPIRAHLNDSQQQLRAELKKVKEQTYYKVNLAESSLSQFSKQLQECRSKVAKEVQDIAVLQLKFSQMQHRVDHQCRQNQMLTQSFIQQSKQIGKDLQKNMKKQLNQLKSTIYKLSANVEEKAFKAISKKIDSSFQSFESDLMENRELLKSLSSAVGIAGEQISNIKELVSKKANFSDVVHYIQSKADRHDIKELSNKIKSNSHPTLPQDFTQTINTQNESSLILSPKKIKPAHHTGKTEFISYPSTQRQKSQGRQASGRKLVDLQGTARKLLIRDTKKRVIKSYSSLISDLRN